MRIGILTPAPRVNYGGIMQAYALQTVLEQMGHDVKIIYTPRKPWGLPLWEKPFAYTKRFLRKYLLYVILLLNLHYEIILITQLIHLLTF